MAIHPDVLEGAAELAVFVPPLEQLARAAPWAQIGTPVGRGWLRATASRHRQPGHRKRGHRGHDLRLQRVITPRAGSVFSVPNPSVGRVDTTADTDLPGALSICDLTIYRPSPCLYPVR